MAGALLEFWQRDGNRDYNNRGNTLRAHQLADAQGRSRLETIVPGVYPGRTRHIHVRVQPRNKRILTTQLYFPGEPQNAQDFLYQPELLITLGETQGTRTGWFNFVLKVD